MFLLVLHRAGPQWQSGLPLEQQSGWEEHAAFMDELVDSGFVVLGGPLGDEFRVVHAIEAESEEAVRATLALDPWQSSHLVIDSIDPWTMPARRSLSAACSPQTANLPLARSRRGHYRAAPVHPSPDDHRPLQTPPIPSRPEAGLRWSHCSSSAASMSSCASGDDPFPRRTTAADPISDHTHKYRKTARARRV